MKKYLLIGILFLIYSCGESQGSVVSNSQLIENGIITEQQSDLIFKKVKEFPNRTQISFAIIENGLAKFYGVKRENDFVHSTENHKKAFEIGSITKVFYSYASCEFCA